VAGSTLAVSASAVRSIVIAPARQPIVSPTASCGVDTSAVNAYRDALTRTLGRTDSVATAIRSQLRLPSVPPATVAIVSDSLTCARVREAIVSTYQQRAQDRRRPLLLARVDTMLVALDWANGDGTVAAMTLVFTESLRFVGAFK